MRKKLAAPPFEARSSFTFGCRELLMSPTTGRLRAGPMFGLEHHPIIDSFLLFNGQRLPPIFELVGVLNLPHERRV